MVSIQNNFALLNEKILGDKKPWIGECVYIKFSILVYYLTTFNFLFINSSGHGFFLLCYRF